MTNSEKRSRRIDILRKIIFIHQEELNLLIKECDHHIICDSSNSAVCKICGEDFGWYCPESSNHICSYSESYHCDYCGEPKERK